MIRKNPLSVVGSRCRDDGGGGSSVVDSNVDGRVDEDDDAVGLNIFPLEQ